MLKIVYKSTFTLVPCSILMKHHLFYNSLSYFILPSTFLLKTTFFLLYVSLRGTILVYLDVPLSSPSYLQFELI